MAKRGVLQARIRVSQNEGHGAPFFRENMQGSRENMTPLVFRGPNAATYYLAFSDVKMRDIT